MQITLTRTITLRVAIVCAFALTGGFVHAQTPGIQVIPAPKQVTPGEGSFGFRRDTRVIRADPKSTEDQFAAHDFINDVKATADVALTTGKGSGRRDILIGRVDSLPVAQA